jgi:hypothetical protein
MLEGTFKRTRLRIRAAPAVDRLYAQPYCFYMSIIYFPLNPSLATCMPQPPDSRCSPADRTYLTLYILEAPSASLTFTSPPSPLLFLSSLDIRRHSFSLCPSLLTVLLFFHDLRYESWSPLDLRNPSRAAPRLAPDTLATTKHFAPSPIQLLE